jgi:hypothetical protein
MPRHSISEKRHHLILDLASVRQDLLQTVSAVPLERLDTHFLGEWSVKDLIAHLIGWDHTNLRAIQEILAGQYPTFFESYDKDWQSYNARLVEKYTLEPFSALLAAVDTSHQQLLTFAESLAPDLVFNCKVKSTTGRTVTIRNLLRAEANDERRHAEQVRAWLGLASSPNAA